MPRLPQPGSDDGTWGNILNDYLSVAHQADGTLKPYSPPTGSVTTASIDPAGLSPTAIIDTALTQAIATAKGDMLAATAAGALGRVGVGGDGQVLTADSTQAAGLKWNTASTTDTNAVHKGDLIFNVKDYGATGDGTTDDTAAIQAAITAASPSTYTAKSGTVFLPAGTYITSPIILPQRMAIQGVGNASTLKLKAASTGDLITNAQSGGTGAQMCEVRYMRLDGNKYQQTSWNSGIVFSNPTPSSNFEYTDARHTVESLTIQNFTGNGFVQASRGVVFCSNVAVWAVDGFGFNLGSDSFYSNCDAGGSGLDGFLIQGGSNRLANCKSWWSGAKLINSAFTDPTPLPTVTSTSTGKWDGANLIVQQVFSLANGFGNGFNWTNISGTSRTGNNSGGSYVGCCAQDNARAGFYIKGSSRHTLVGCEADSNNNNGTSDGTSTGTPAGSYAGFDLDGSASNNYVDGTSWERSANRNHQAAALRLVNSGGYNRVSLGFYGSLNDGTTNMPPLTSDSLTSGNDVSFKSQRAYVSATFASTYTPDPFKGRTFSLTLTGNITIANAALAGTNTGAGLYLMAGMEITLILTQDTTGGRTVTWGNAFSLNGLQVSVAANAVTTARFVYNGTSWIQTGSAATAATAGASLLPAASVISGDYLVTAISGTTSTSSGPWTLGQIMFSPVDVAASQTFTGIASNISTTVGAGGTTPLIHMGLYADNGGLLRPGSGSPLAGTEVTYDPTLTAGEHYVAWASPQTLTPGRYWLAWMLTSGSALTTNPTMVTGSLVLQGGLSTLSNSSIKGWGYVASSSAATFPTLTEASLFHLGGTWPLIGLKAQ